MASFRDLGRAVVSGTVSLQDVVALVLLDFSSLCLLSLACCEAELLLLRRGGGN